MLSISCDVASRPWFADLVQCCRTAEGLGPHGENSLRSQHALPGEVALHEKGKDHGHPLCPAVESSFSWFQLVPLSACKYPSYCQSVLDASRRRSRSFSSVYVCSVTEQHKKSHQNAMAAIWKGKRGQRGRYAAVSFSSAASTRTCSIEARRERERETLRRRCPCQGHLKRGVT